MFVEVINFFLSPIFYLFEPHLSNTINAATSEKTQRKAIKSVFIFVVALVLITVAVVAYLGFYMIYIPKIAHVKPIYLQYQKDSSPYALIDFTENGLYESFLTADQAYDIEIDLDVPTSDRNVALGNFMIGIELMAKNETVRYSSRPCILTYRSGLLRVSYTLWRLIPLVLGFTKEDQKLVIIMIENMIESAEKPITQALITISNSHLEVYSAQIRLDAHFRGLRYFMYYHQIPTAITFITMFLTWEILFSIFAWKSFVSWWQDKVSMGPQKTLITSGGTNDTNNITYNNNNQDDDSERDDSRRSDTVERDNGTATESESEYEMLRSDSVISPTNTALASESGETSYNTESYITDDDDPDPLPLEDDDSSIVVTETDGDDSIDDEDQTEGSLTPTTRSRRSTVSETSTNESEIEDGPSTSTSTARLQSGSTRAYTRRAGSSGDNNDSNMG